MFLFYFIYGYTGNFILKKCPLFIASNIVFMSTKAVLVDFGLSVQMTEDIYFPKDLRGTEVILFPQGRSISF